MNKRVIHTGVITGLTELEILELESPTPNCVYIPKDNPDKTYNVDVNGIIDSEDKVKVIYVTQYEAQKLRLQDTRQTISPKSGNWENLRDKSGIRASYYTTPTSFNRPTGLFSDGAKGKLFFCDYSARGGELNLLNGSPITKEFGHTYNNPTGSNDAFRYAVGVSVSPDGSLYALNTHVRDVVRVYNMADGSLVSTVGVPSSSGNFSANKLNNPYGCTMFLSNQVLAVGSYQGNTESSGGIQAWDITTPTANRLTLLMEGESSGATVGSNLVDNPFDIKADPANAGKAYVMEYGKNRILHVDMGIEWTVERIINPPSGVYFWSAWGMAVSHDGSKLAVCSQSTGQISIIDSQTGDLLNMYGGSEYDILCDPRSVEFFDDDFIAVCGWNSRSIHLLPIEKQVRVDYNSIVIPEGMAIYKAVTDLGVFNFDDINNPYLMVDVDKLDMINDVTILFNEV